MPKTQRAPRRAPDTRVRISRQDLNDLSAKAGLAAIAQVELEKAGVKIGGLENAVTMLKAEADARGKSVFGRAEALAESLHGSYGPPKPNLECQAAMQSAYLTRRGTTKLDGFDIAILAILGHICNLAAVREPSGLVAIAWNVHEAERIFDAA